MSWHFQNGRWEMDRTVHEFRSAAPSVATAAPASQSQQYIFHDFVNPGELVETRNEPSESTWMAMSLDFSKVPVLVQRGQNDSTRILGVSTGDRRVATNGIVMAWFVPDTTVYVPLAGTYQWTINGVPQGQQVLLKSEDDSFVLARTASDEIERLKNVVTTLTNAPL